MCFDLLDGMSIGLQQQVPGESIRSQLVTGSRCVGRRLDISFLCDAAANFHGSTLPG